MPGVLQYDPKDDINSFVSNGYSPSVGINDTNDVKAANTSAASARDYNEKQTNSARAWEEYMSSTSYQRAYKDLLAAGLNPRLILSGLDAGTFHGVSSGSSYSYSQSSSESKSESNSNSMSWSAIIAALILLGGKLLLK